MSEQSWHVSPGLSGPRARGFATVPCPAVGERGPSLSGDEDQGSGEDSDVPGGGGRKAGAPSEALRCVKAEAGFGVRLGQRQNWAHEPDLGGRGIWLFLS